MSFRDGCRIGLLFGVFSLLAACGSSAPPAGLHDAYVWQRAWRGAVQQALHESAAMVGVWHVLAGEIDAQGRMQGVAVDFSALSASGRPAIPVIRIDGAMLPTQDVAPIVALLDRWPAVHPWRSIEIDHDSAARRLGEYARFLERLRAAIGSPLRLSITLLPDWLDSPDIQQLLDAADEVVLQLHGLPRAGDHLFDPARARHWVGRMAQSGKPFRIALPNYGSRLARDEAGRVLGVESEVPVALPAGETRELFVSPVSVAAFLRVLEKAPPRHFLGVVWFRLPVAGDVRVWSRATWHAVMRKEALSPQLRAEWRPADGEKKRGDVLLLNTGVHDAELPAQLNVGQSCRSHAAARDRYVHENEATGSVLLRSRKGLLRAGEQLRLAGLDCPESTAAIVLQIID